jgi:hypothetical protein
LKGLDDLEIGDIKFLVLGSVEILFCYKNTLYVGGPGLSCEVRRWNGKRTFEEVLVDCTLVLLGNDHVGWVKIGEESLV